jgi:hypothetical protein
MGSIIKNQSPVKFLIRVWLVPDQFFHQDDDRDEDFSIKV